MPDAPEIHGWDAIDRTLRERFPKPRYDYWIAPLVCTRFGASEVELEVPSKVHGDHLRTHFELEIARALEEAIGTTPRLSFVFPQEDTPVVTAQGSLFRDDGTATLEHPPEPVEAVSEPPDFWADKQALSGDYTLDDFVVGPSNQFAHAAAMAVASRPAENYNPLFIYGGVGLGKTHLMQAIGNEVHSRFGHRVAYVTSEEFMNELITGIQNRDMVAFRERYRQSCDILLIDDIQFIAGKERTQEEFFHTFNALHASRKQIILTSDKTPQEIPGLQERLQSRFSWGLMADIKRPEMETRVAILRKKARQLSIDLPHEVALFLANTVDSNVRELEGSLRALAARAKFELVAPTVALAREVVGPFINSAAVGVTADRIIKHVCAYFDLKLSEMKSKSRTRRIAHPRQLAMYLARHHTDLSYPELGRAFGRDHTTIINGVRKIERLVGEDPVVKSQVDALNLGI